jgi:hypothetical protein
MEKKVELTSKLNKKLRVLLNNLASFYSTDKKIEQFKDEMFFIIKTHPNKILDKITTIVLRYAKYAYTSDYKFFFEHKMSDDVDPNFEKAELLTYIVDKTQEMILQLDRQKLKDYMLLSQQIMDLLIYRHKLVLEMIENEENEENNE